MTPQSPRYKHYDLGRQPAGTVVEVALSSINNVRLMDERNYRLYASSQPCKFLGGPTVKTPTKLTVPAAGQWHLIVDREGLPKLANSNVRTIQPGNYKTRVQEPEAGDMPTTEPPDDRTETTASAETHPEHSPEAMAEILKALDQYKHIANTDALTGLANRRAFDQKLASVFGGDMQAAALVICDVDHFKTFNDTYGHAIGDDVLKIVAGIMRDHAAEDVFVARTGGEEFAMIVQGRDASGAQVLAERVRIALEETPFQNDHSGADYGRITVSMGICMCSDATSPEDVYAKADNALYASKKAGRNRCTLFAEGLQAAG